MHFVGTVVRVECDPAFVEERLTLSRVFYGIEVKDRKSDQLIVRIREAPMVDRRSQLHALTHPVLAFSVKSRREDDERFCGHGSSLEL